MCVGCPRCPYEYRMHSAIFLVPEKATFSSDKITSKLVYKWEQFEINECERSKHYSRNILLLLKSFFGKSSKPSIALKYVLNKDSKC